MQTIEPIGNRIVLKQDTPEDTTKGGIIVPDRAKEHRASGTVVVTGPDCKQCAVGDHILYAMYAGTDFSLKNDDGEDEPFVAITEADVICIVLG